MRERLQSWGNSDRWGRVIELFLMIIIAVIGDRGWISFRSGPRVAYVILPTYEVSIETTEGTLEAATSGLRLENKGDVQEDNLIVAIKTEGAIIQGLTLRPFATMATLDSGGPDSDHVTYIFDKPVNPDASPTIFITTDKPTTLHAMVEYSKGKAVEESYCPSATMIARLLQFLGIWWIVHLARIQIFRILRNRI